VHGREVIDVPLYALDHFPASGEVESGKFRQVRTIYFEADEGSFDVGNRFFAECWVDLNNPKIRKGDILLVDMNETHLTENGHLPVQDADHALHSPTRSSVGRKCRVNRGIR